jgi:hypothetical protein
MPIIRAQVRLPYFTGLPEDIVTNTWHFETGELGPSAGELDECVARLEAAYDLVDQLMAATLSRVADACEIRIYNLADPEPREPVRTSTFTLDTPESITNLPLECAIVLSYHAEFVSGVPNARRRGRAYIGPFALPALTVGNASVFPFTQTIAQTAVRDMATALDTEIGWPLQWVQYSPTTGLANPVVAGWVDNEFDTQRRRQARATGRLTFTL